MSRIIIDTRAPLHKSTSHIIGANRNHLSGEKNWRGSSPPTARSGRFSASGKSSTASATAPPTGGSTSRTAT